ncbi:MAG: bifunctional aspartate kinase/homoserine dehydrogenase I [Pseudomonadota bacterium]
MTASAWQVHKFGGSSLADATCFRRVRDLVLGADGQQSLAVVVSAMGGMTDQLIALAVGAERADSSPDTALRLLADRYEAAAGALLDPEPRQQVLDAWQADCSDIKDLLQAVQLLGSAPQRTSDIIAGYGEIWSSRLLAALLAQDAADRAVCWVDAREIVIVSQTRLGPSVQWQRSKDQLSEHAAIHAADIAIITGFVASDEQGRQTTLGRNGSDHSAAIFAALLRARSITIWTDVPGVLSGDPRRIPEAQVIDKLSYNEAMELAYFGAKVIHPQTMGPAVQNDIPIFIKSTFAPDAPGTCVSTDAGRDDAIKGITSISDVAVINVEGAGMIGVPGTAHRIFRALREAEISVTLISQASSEHSVCFVVSRDVAHRAADVVTNAFDNEMRRGQIQNVSVQDDCSIVAVVGDRMSGTPGVAGKFLHTLGQAGINVIAIAQGSSERNISVVVPSADATRAIRAVHGGFYLSAKTLSIGIIGPGNVGGELIAQIRSEAARLQSQFNLDLRVRALKTSRKMLLGAPRIDVPDWQAALHGSDETPDLHAFVSHVDADHLPHAVIIDCTASEAVADCYANWMARGIHIITPNKRAFSGPRERYDAIKAAARQGDSRCFYETTVGAALPIVQTLQDLRETGDRVRSVQGIFSGTLAYLFNVYDGSKAFSEIVREAKQAGYTEPDPRDDLSGMDVARKLVILARELDYDADLAEVDVESLVPVSLAAVSVDEFLDGLAAVDADMQARFEQARGNDCVLRYLGEITETGTLHVRLVEVPAASAFANLALTDNLVRISSNRYSDNPLVIQGPGAGPEVTAAGVFADLLRLSSQLGNRR